MTYNWFRYLKLPINDHSHTFDSYRKLLNHLRNQLLPTCNSARRYEFHITFDVDRHSIPNVIPSILELSQIIRCSNVLIDINNAREDLPWSYMWTENIKLPAEIISNWLNYNFDHVQETKNQARKERLLELCMHRVSFENARAVCNQMKKVYLTNLEQKNYKFFTKN